jgi:hypothetical protein
MDSDGTAGDWLALADAARVLGVSERTLRRHMRADRYRVRHDGNRIYLLVSADEAKGAGLSLDGDFSGDRPSPVAAPDALVVRVDRLEAGLGHLVQRLESLERERVTEQGRRIERLDWLTDRLLNRTESLRRALLTLERRSAGGRPNTRLAEGPVGETGPSDRLTGGVRNAPQSR